MKKSSHSSKSKKKSSAPKSSRAGIAPLDDAVVDPSDKEELAGEQFTVSGREEEASSSGHRVEPIEEDDEHNAEKLVEEGLHGYVRASPNHPRKAR